MAINTTLESVDEQKQIFSKVRYYENPKALSSDKQKKYDRLNKAQSTPIYPDVLNQVRKELINS